MAARKQLSFLKRVGIAARFAFSGYDAAKNTRKRANRGLGAIRSEESELTRYDRDRVISAALDFRRNNPVVASLSRLRKCDVVGRGVIPQPSTGDDSLDKEIEMAWAEFARAPESTGTMDMRDLQQQLVDALLFYGDAGLIIGDQQVQFIDGSLIGNPDGEYTASENQPWQNGVRINSQGQPVAYGVGRRINGTLTDVSAFPARDFLPFYRRLRPIQYRGIPELAPIINTLQDIDEYDGIEMIAAKTSAALAAYIKREGSLDYQLGNQNQEQDSVGGLEYIDPGRISYLEPGEDIGTVSTSGRPNVDGVQWVSYLLRKVGSAVGIPLEFLLMEIGGSSFSASQGVVLQYQQTIESYQGDLIRIMDQLYRRWLLQLISDGDIMPTAKASPFKVRWQRPAFRWINRAAQVKADLEYYRLGAASLDDITAPFGYTAEDVMSRKAQNIVTAQKIAEDAGLDWRDIINEFPTTLSGNLNETITD